MSWLLLLFDIITLYINGKEASEVAGGKASRMPLAYNVSRYKGDQGNRPLALSEGRFYSKFIQ